MDFAKIGVIGLGLSAIAGQASAAESLCAPTEQVVFSCRVKDSAKLVSVCGRGGSFLQYRFGLYDKPELVFPERSEGSIEKFRAAHEYVPSAFYESDQLSFRSGGNEYRVYAVSEPADEGPNAAPTRYGGVIVGTASGRDINIPCGTVPQNELGGLVRKTGAAQRDGQTVPDGVRRARFELCRAMPVQGGTGDMRLDPRNDAFMLGLHETPDVVELDEGAVEHLAVAPRHGNLARRGHTTGGRATWLYTPAPDFVGSDRAEFVVRGKEKAGDPVEFRLIYKLRMRPDSLRAYAAGSGAPLQPVRDLYCLMPSMLLDYVGAQ